MRALLRADIMPESAYEKLSPLFNKRDSSKEFREEIKKIFIEIGFSHEGEHYQYETSSHVDSPDENDLHISKDEEKAIFDIFEEVPRDQKWKELQTMCFIGYIGEGHTTFVVNVINTTELYIRIKTDYFKKTTDACKQFSEKIHKHKQKSTRTFSKSETKGYYLQLKNEIEIREAKRDVPTIVGKIIGHEGILMCFLQSFRTHKISALLFILGICVLFLVLLIERSWEAQDLKNTWFSRVFPAFLTFLLANSIPIFTTARDYYKNAPILWSNKVTDNE